MQKIAKAISLLFHPLLMPTIGILLLMNTGFYFALISFEAKKYILLIVFTSTCLLPLISIGILLLFTRFKLDLDKHGDRILPFMSTALFYYLGYYLLGRLPIFPIYRILLIGSIFTIALLMFISVRWKISAHLAGIGGLIGAMLALSLRLSINSSDLLAGLIIIAGLLGSSRILLGKHSPLQVYAGFTMGFIVNYLLIGFI
ncbi:MAG: phosphatase PAP2 family protein [Mangrovibacterium sp.]